MFDKYFYLKKNVIYEHTSLLQCTYEINETYDENNITIY